MKAEKRVRKSELLETGWTLIYSFKHFQVFEKQKVRLRWNKKTKKIVKKYKPVKEKYLLLMGWSPIRNSKFNNWKMFVRKRGEVLFWDPRTEEVIKCFDSTEKEVFICEQKSN